MVAVGTGTAAVIDLRTRRVPNVLTMIMASAGIARRPRVSGASA